MRPTFVVALLAILARSTQLQSAPPDDRAPSTKAAPGIALRATVYPSAPEPSPNNKDCSLSIMQVPVLPQAQVVARIRWLNKDGHYMRLRGVSARLVDLNGATQSDDDWPEDMRGSLFCGCGHFWKVDCKIGYDTQEVALEILRHRRELNRLERDFEALIRRDIDPDALTVSQD